MNRCCVPSKELYFVLVLVRARPMRIIQAHLDDFSLVEATILVSVQLGSLQEHDRMGSS